MLSLDSTWSEAFAKAGIEAYRNSDQSPGALNELERECMTQLMALGRAMMQAVLEEVAAHARPEDTRYKPVVVSGLSVMTVFGEVRAERPRFRAVRNGPTHDAVAAEFGLVAGFWTPEAAKIAGLAVAEMPTERAEALLTCAGVVPASRSSLQRLTHFLGALHEGERDAHEAYIRSHQEIPEGAVTVTLSLDGVMVMMVTSDKAQKKCRTKALGKADKGPAGWREAGVAVVSYYDANGERLLSRRYGRMPESNKATLKAWLREELQHIRAQRPDLTVVAIADGAPNNWTFLESLAPDEQVVDFFHTVEHLHRHVNRAKDASSLESQAILTSMRRRLLTVPGAAQAVAQELQDLRERAGTQAVSTTRKHGRRQPTYFERHTDRMEYPRLRARKIPIGSGVTESTCKLVVCDRLRRTGMRWSSEGGQAVMTLRAWLVSDSFDHGWDALMATNRKALAA